VLLCFFCLDRGADCLHMVHLMPLHPKTPSSLTSFKSRLVVVTFLVLAYPGLQLPPEKRPLNWCSSSSSICMYWCVRCSGVVYVTADYTASHLHSYPQVKWATPPSNVPLQSITTFRLVLISTGWLGSRVVRVLDSGTEWPGFKSQSRCCRVTVLGKLFTPIVPLFTKQQNW